MYVPALVSHPRRHVPLGARPCLPHPPLRHQFSSCTTRQRAVNRPSGLLGVNPPLPTCHRESRGLDLTSRVPFLGCSPRDWLQTTRLLKLVTHHSLVPQGHREQTGGFKRPGASTTRPHGRLQQQSLAPSFSLEGLDWTSGGPGFSICFPRGWLIRA